MANTYSQLYFHVIFSVRGRMNLIADSWEINLHKYMTGIITNNNQKMMCINGMPDHVHLLISTRPNCNLSDLIRDLKANSSKWVNKNNYVRGKFHWQTGFGIFTVSPSQVSKVACYIERQKEHHQKKTFREEYIEFLKAHNIEYKEEYIFD